MSLKFEAKDFKWDTPHVPGKFNYYAAIDAQKVFDSWLKGQLVVTADGDKARYWDINTHIDGRDTHQAYLVDVREIEKDCVEHDTYHWLGKEGRPTGIYGCRNCDKKLRPVKFEEVK